MARSVQGVRADDCVFCDVIAGKVEPGVVALQTPEATAFPSLHQRDANRGHMLVVPSVHTPDIYRVADAAPGLLGAVSVVARAVRAGFCADGITVVQHNEWAGGQDVFHLHVHVIPRFADDGFYRGDVPYPRGLNVVPLETRLAQAVAVRANLDAPLPPHPEDTYPMPRKDGPW